jgi:hypothetical protein
MIPEKVEEILTEWQQRLRLYNWDLKIRWEMPCELGCDAEIRISDDYEQASLRIQQVDDPTTTPSPTRSYRTWSDHEANRVIVHELLHIFEKQTKRAVEAAGPIMPKNTYELLWAWYEHGSENWVDRIAIILVELGGVV